MLENKEGQSVPQVTFRTRQDGDWLDRTTDEIFAGRTVIVFSLPGAFTPTCSSTHLPRYNELASVFNRSGVDEIVCMSVNDAFVMDAWKADQEAENITLIGDGNGEFTAAMGLLVDKSDLGFGQRSWRYSMLVEDGTVKKMFIEPEEPGDPFKVSDADSMLAYINPDAEVPGSVSIFTKPGCPHCAVAKRGLKDNGYAFEEIVLGTDASITSLRAISGSETVPQVFIDGQHIGDGEALAEMLKYADVQSAA
jgi:glutaredoxin-like protein